MSALYIRETFVNETEHSRFGSSEWYEAFTDDLGKLFRDLRKEYGKASNMYRDLPDGEAEKIGWVFTGRARYEDTGKPYTRSVWIEVSSSEPYTKWVNTTNPFKREKRHGKAADVRV